MDDDRCNGTAKSEGRRAVYGFSGDNARASSCGRDFDGLGQFAIVWTLPADHSCFSPRGFLEGSGEAALCQIVTPGLAAEELRGGFGAVSASKRSVGGSWREFSSGNCAHLVPGAVAPLERILHNPVRGWVGPDFSDSWRFWRVRLDWSRLTEFQRAVLEVVAVIPRGERYTYGRVAQILGKPQASRAVGAALGANPWPVLVPCHRVVGANGSMTGFSAPGGVAAKRRMLEMEALA